MVSRTLAPMEMRSVASIPDGPEWQFEPKWDGFRALAHRDGDDVALVSKAGQPLARYFPEVARAVTELAVDGLTLDGELVVPQAGALSFDALQQRIHPAASRVTMLSQQTPAWYLVFDLLREDGASLLELPLRERRGRLERLWTRIGTNATLRLSPATTDRRIAEQWFAGSGGALDGIVAKRLDKAYASGRRDAAVKIKQTRTADCVIGGFRFAAGSQDEVGSLLLGLYDDTGLLDYIGFCSAFSRPERRALLARLAPFRGGGGFTGGAPDSGPSRWNRDSGRDRSYVPLAPELVLEVAFDQVTSGRIRHGTKPVRWRTDKPPHRCTFDQLETPAAGLALLTMPQSVRADDVAG